MFFDTPAFDLDILHLVNETWRNPFFDFIMPVLSSMGVLLVILAAALAWAVYKGGKRQIIFFLVLLAGMGVCDFTTNIIKKQAKRVRPLNAIAEIHFREDGEWTQRPADFVQTKTEGRSFPSAHSSNTMCLAALVMLLWPAMKKWPLLLPLAVGYSRIYLGKHYPTDLIGGWLYGLIVAMVIWLVWKQMASRLVPERN